MSLSDLVGRVVPFTVLRAEAGELGLGLSDSDEPLLWLPKEGSPPGTLPGAQLQLFVHLNAEGRPVATTLLPKLSLGEVAFLEITGITHFGAFAAWGLPKDLLVPSAEQVGDLKIGERHPIGLILDPRGRLTGTQRITEMLELPEGLAQNDWVEGEAWRNEPEIGLFVILQKRFVGRVPASEPHTLKRGQAARFRVTAVLPDGKVALSLRRSAFDELESDAERVLAVLSEPKAPEVGDSSAPELIRSRFGLSKKAFKRAVGRLLKQGIVTLNDRGFVVRVPNAGRAAP